VVAEAARFSDPRNSVVALGQNGGFSGLANVGFWPTTAR